MALSDEDTARGRLRAQATVEPGSLPQLARTVTAIDMLLDDGKLEPPEAMSLAFRACRGFLGKEGR